MNFSYELLFYSSSIMKKSQKKVKTLHTYGTTDVVSLCIKVFQKQLIKTKCDLFPNR